LWLASNDRLGRSRVACTRAFQFLVAAVIDIRTLFAATTCFALLAGCGEPASTSDPKLSPIAAKPDVTITIDGVRHVCDVALYGEPQGSAVSCGEVVPFIRDELRLSNGSIYDIRTTAGVGETEVASVGASMNGAGYRYIGGPHATSITTHQDR
jgi:hypothetical protein